MNEWVMIYLILHLCLMNMAILYSSTMLSERTLRSCRNTKKKLYLCLVDDILMTTSMNRHVQTAR